MCWESGGIKYCAFDHERKPQHTEPRQPVAPFGSRQLRVWLCCERVCCTSEIESNTELDDPFSKGLRKNHQFANGSRLTLQPAAQDLAAGDKHVTTGHADQRSALQVALTTNPHRHAVDHPASRLLKRSPRLLYELGHGRISSGRCANHHAVDGRCRQALPRLLR